MRAADNTFYVLIDDAGRTFIAVASKAYPSRHIYDSTDGRTEGFLGGGCSDASLRRLRLSLPLSLCACDGCACRGRRMHVVCVCGVAGCGAELRTALRRSRVFRGAAVYHASLQQERLTHCICASVCVVPCPAVLQREFTAKYADESLSCEPDALSNKSRVMLKDLCDKCVAQPHSNALLLLALR